MKRILPFAAAALLWAGAASAGEYHSGGTLFCADCHTMHASMQHGFAGGTSISGTPVAGGDWLSNNGGTPINFLLKASGNQLCLSCHDGQTFAPDVVGGNANASPSQGRSAGALNEAGLGGGYDTWKGHTLDSTATPPGYDPAAVGATANWYNPANGLECTSCHAQHGPATSYRNLGPYAMGGANFRPTYVLGPTNDTTKDVWVNLATTTVTTGSGSAATFNPYYAAENVSYNRNDATIGTTKTSNRLDSFCGGCHGKFHGGAGDAGTGGQATAAALDGFARHPTSQVTIGAAGAQGYGGHSALSRYTGATNKVKVYASDRVGFTDASPGCVSCHKAHGNQNPFGLVFMSRTTGTPGEQGSADGQDIVGGQRNLCGQCHGQGS
jgi:predicted CXXCH cytochrome family protein